MTMTTSLDLKLPLELVQHIFAYNWSLNDAIQEGQDFVLQILVLGSPDTIELTPEMLDTAASLGHLNLVELLHQHSPKGCTKEAMDQASKNGHLEIVKFLHTKRQEGCTPKALDEAIAHKHIEIAKYLIQNVKKIVWSSNSLTWTAVEQKDVDLLKAFLTNSPRTVSKDAKEKAYQVNNIPQEILKCLYEYNQDKRLTFNLVHAASKGDLTSVKFFLTNGEGFFKVAMVEACTKGHLEIVQYLLTNGHNKEKHTPQSLCVLMDEAAANGHLEILQLLNEHGGLTCSTRAMNMAATKGHEEIVVYLHTKRQEGCTKVAMDMAAANNHLKILKFLHTNRTEGCTTGAIDHAARNRHFCVVEFLLTNRKEGFTSRAIEESILNQDLNTLKILCIHAELLDHNKENGSLDRARRIASKSTIKDQVLEILDQYFPITN